MIQWKVKLASGELLHYEVPVSLARSTELLKELVRVGFVILNNVSLINIANVATIDIEEIKGEKLEVGN